MKRRYIVLGVTTVLVASIANLELVYKNLESTPTVSTQKSEAILDCTYDYTPSTSDMFLSTEELEGYLLEDIAQSNQPTKSEYNISATEDDKKEVEILLEAYKKVQAESKPKSKPKPKPKTTQEQKSKTPSLSQSLNKYSTNKAQKGNTKNSLPNSHTTSYTQSKEYKNMVNNMTRIAEACLGTPYVWGGETIHKGMDCSGFAQYVYQQLGFSLPRTASLQSKVGKPVKRTELRPGDLLFFDTSRSRTRADILTPEEELVHAQQIQNGSAQNVVSHVGLYMGNGKMIHAASGDGYVKYESLDSEYYRNRFINARRLIRDTK